MKTIDDILNRILTLHKDAEVGIVGIDDDEAKLEKFSDPIALKIRLPDDDHIYGVTWNKNNTTQCPTLEELEALTDEEVTEAANERRKKFRDLDATENLHLVAAFSNEKKTKPTLTLSEFLDQLEDEAKKLKKELKDK